MEWTTSLNPYYNISVFFSFFFFLSIILFSTRKEGLQENKN